MKKIRVLLVGFDEYTNRVLGYLSPNIFIDTALDNYDIIRDLPIKEYDYIIYAPSPKIYLPPVISVLENGRLNDFGRNTFLFVNRHMEDNKNKLYYNDLRIFKDLFTRFTGSEKNVKFICFMPDRKYFGYQDSVLERRFSKQIAYKGRRFPKSNIVLEEHEWNILGAISFKNIFFELNRSLVVLKRHNRINCQEANELKQRLPLFNTKNYDFFASIFPQEKVKSENQHSPLYHLLFKEEEWLNHVASPCNFEVQRQDSPLFINIDLKENEKSEICNGNMEIAVCPQPECNDEIIHTLTPVLTYELTETENISLRLKEHYSNKTQKQFPLIGESENLKHYLWRTAMASFDLNGHVIIMGETGSGKEITAEIIQGVCPRNGEFVAVNCASLEPNLAESHLFGHLRGAFTGANSSRKGLVETAKDGILFLDEINHLPMECLVKLLRLLETNEYQKLGSDYISKADVKLIVAANTEDFLSDEQITKTGFLQRFAYIINVPPLRYRDKDDIEKLAGFFFKQLAEDEKLASASTLKNIPDELMEFWKNQTWENSNVRGLKMAVRNYFYQNIAFHVLSNGINLTEFSRKRGPKNKLSLDDLLDYMQGVLDEYKYSFGLHLQKRIKGKTGKFKKKQNIRNFLSKNKGLNPQLHAVILDMFNKQFQDYPE
jgi:transcriptional regulator with AAA-type ATPase domain